MPKLLRGALAVVLGIVIGSAVNMGLILVGARLIPPPAGVDVATMESLRASMHLFEPRHFLFPFLAHAAGTLVGALVATLVVAARSSRPAYAVGALFLAGGIANIFMLPAPVWFSAADLLLAYLPAAWLGHQLAIRGLRRGAVAA